MDGVVILVTAAALKTEVGDIACEDALGTAIKKEICLEPFKTTIWQRAHGFHNAVTVPSKIFVEHWGGEDFVALVLQAMMSGELAEIRHFFEERTDIENAWEKLFKRPEFSLHTERSI